MSILPEGIGKLLSSDFVKEILLKKASEDENFLFDYADFANMSTEEVLENLLQGGEFSDDKLAELYDVDTETDNKSHEEELKKAVSELDSLKDIIIRADINNDGILSESEYANYLSAASEAGGKISLMSDSALEDTLKNFGIDLESIQGLLSDDVMPSMQNNFGQDLSLSGMGSVGASQSVQGINADAFTADVNAVQANISMTAGGSSYAGTSASQIESEIESKKSSIADINATASEKIAQQEMIYSQAVEEAMQNHDIAEEVQSQFKSEKSRLDTAIASSESQISIQKGIVKDQEAVIKSKESSITNINGQIKSLEEVKSLANPFTAMAIDGIISQLEERIRQLESDIKDANGKIDDANSEIKSQESEKSRLEKEKQGLLSTLSSQYSDQALGSVIKELSSVQRQTQQSIAQIKAQQESDTNSLLSDISGLKVRLQTAEESERTQELIQNNALYQYNAKAGEEIAKIASEDVDSRGDSLSKVNSALEETYGSGIPSASKAKEALSGKTPGYEQLASHFKEVPADQADINNLPPGAIVIWENNEISSSDDVKTHLSIALGGSETAGEELPGGTENEKINFTVFIPI